ncbi:MAG: hypothetical protein ACRD96_08045, partial [Bryobacteraceae bacterium]
QANADLANPVEIADAAGNLRGLTFNYLYSGFDGRSRYLEPVFKNNIEPRYAFAWQPKWGWLKRAVVLRGGYGISHPATTGRGRNPIPDFGAGTSGAWGYVRWANANPPPRTQSVDPQFLVRLGANRPVMNITPGILDIPKDGKLCQNCPPARDPRVPGGALVVFSQDASAPYVQTWNLTTQIELPGEMVLTASYLGNKGTHLYSPLIPINNPDPLQYEDLLNEGGDPNELVEDPFGRLDAAGNLVLIPRVNLMRPIPTAGDISIGGTTNSNSIFHAGAFSIDRRYTDRLIRFVRFNYTWGKSIDSASDGNLQSAGNIYLWGDTRLQDSDNLKANRSTSNFDTKHRFNFVMQTNLPFGRKQRLLANHGKLVGGIASDWQVSTIISVSSGIPFAPYLGDPNGIPGANAGNERVRPHIVPGVPLINPRWSK